MLGAARVVVLISGVILAALGLVVLAAGAVIAGIYMTGIGLVVVIGAVIERTRYRSAEADRMAAPHGPGGGEPAGTQLEPRFAPTDEVFEDPTSGLRMRVWLDRATGERRYVALD